MRLAILNPTLPAYKKDFFESMNNRLKEENIELTVIYGKNFFNKTVKSIENPDFYTIPLKAIEISFWGYRIAWWRGIFRFIRKLEPGIIIINFNTGNLSLWIVQFYCYLKKIKVGIWSCGYSREEISGFKEKLRNIFVNFYLYRSNFHICYGTKYKNDLLQLGIPESKVFVAQNTVNIENILSEDWDPFEKLSSRDVTFLFVGALIKEKRLKLAIKAFANLVSEGYNIKFNIVGQGALIDELRSLVIEEHMEHNIFIMGPKYGEELSYFFRAADIFILPGTGGLAINEAMAYGLPVISTVGDGTIPDLLFENENGYFLDDYPTQENIYLTCKKALNNSKEKLHSMGMKSREIVQKKATLQKMISGFIEAINSQIN